MLDALDLQIGRQVVAGRSDREIAERLERPETEIAERRLALYASTGTVSRGELATAWAAVDQLPDPERRRLLLERNAWRQRCHDLEQTLGFLIGRPAESTRDAQRIAELTAERDALRAA